MKWSRVAVVAGPLTLILVGASACGGAALPPKELTDARSEFQQAKNGVAIRRSELIGLIPRGAVEATARYYLGTL